MPERMDEEPGQDVGNDTPSLELPSLGWRRKRRRAAPTTPDAGAPEPSATEPPTPVEPVEPVDPEPTIPVSVVVAPAEPALAEPALAEPAPTPAPELASETEPQPPRPERGPGGTAAVVLTGLVVGLGIVGLTWASLRLCEEVQGTSSCGDTGYGLLIAILAAMIVVGALMLRLLRVPEPGSTSFLAVGLTATLALVFLVDSLMDRPMVVVIPLITAGTFAAAHWVTRTFADPSARA